MGAAAALALLLAEQALGEPMLSAGAANVGRTLLLSESGEPLLSESGEPALKALVPLYVYPTISDDGDCTEPAWLSVAEGGAKVTAIINPNSGPVGEGQPQYSPYLACSSMLAAAGVTLVGYVHTKAATETSPGVWTQSGLLPLNNVLAAVNLYATTGLGSLLSGIFVDEVSNVWSATEDAEWGDHEAFYLQIFAGVRHATPAGRAEWQVVANAGGPPPSSLLDSADVTVIFENSMAAWDPTQQGGTCLDSLWTDAKGSFAPGPWCPLVPEWDGVDELIASASAGSAGSALAALVYGATGGTLGDTVAQARAAGVSLLYVTDTPVTAPWSTLSGLWAQLLQEMAASSAVPPLQPPPSPPPPSTAPAPLGVAICACAVKHGLCNMTCAAVQGLIFEDNDPECSAVALSYVCGDGTMFPSDETYKDACPAFGTTCLPSPSHPPSPSPPTPSPLSLPLPSPSPSQTPLPLAANTSLPANGSLPAPLPLPSNGSSSANTSSPSNVSSPTNVSSASNESSPLNVSRPSPTPSPSPSPSPPPSPSPSPSPSPPPSPPPAPPSSPPPSPPPSPSPPAPPSAVAAEATDEVCDEWQRFIQKRGTRDLEGKLTLLDEEGDVLEALKGYGAKKANACADLDELFAHKPASKRAAKCKKAYRREERNGRTLLHACTSGGHGCVEGDVATDVSDCHAHEDADEEKKDWWAAWREGVALGGASCVLLGAAVKTHRSLHRSRAAKKRRPPAVTVPADVTPPPHTQAVIFSAEV